MHNLSYLPNNQKPKLREISVIYGDSIFKPSEISSKSLGEVFNLIESNNKIEKKINAIRQSTDDNKKKTLKRKLPFFMSGLFKDFKNKEHFVSTEILIFDIDHLATYNFDEIRKLLENWKCTSAVFTSPSGNGLKLIIRLNKSITSSEEYYEVYGKTLGYLTKQFKINFDHSTCDPARACFLSHDNDIYINETADEFDINLPDKDNSKTLIKQNENRRTDLLEKMNGVSKGKRHDALLSTIGIFLSKGLDKDFIRTTAYGINQLNDPPYTYDEFNKEFESIYTSLSNKADDKIIFKAFIETKQGCKITIDSSKLIDFLSDNGFRKTELSPTNYVFVRIQNNLIRQVSVVDVKDLLSSYLKTNNDKDKETVRALLIKGNSTYLTEGTLSFLPTITITTKRGEKDCAYMFFQNVYLEITKDHINVLQYSQLNEELIWADSIIPRKLDLNCFYNDTTPSEYSQMLKLICRNEDAWYNALTSAIGYAAHDYKDKANARAIIFCDEEIPAADDSNGGTGKSLVCEGLRYLKNTVVIDGKNFKSDSAFIFQNINYNTELAIIDDARKSLDFESLLSAITSDITIEKKHQHPLTIPFEKAPKFLITTNYTIKGNGNSFDRRKQEIEFSNYYNKKHTPLDEFGHRLYDDWTDVEWTRFYKTIAGYIQNYLRNGLVKYEVRNLKTRRIIDATCAEFLDFAIDNITPNTEHNKKGLLFKFQELYPEYNHLKSRTFSRWLNVYAGTFDFKVDERKSNADRFIRFNCDMPTIETASIVDNDEINDDSFENMESYDE